MIRASEIRWILATRAVTLFQLAPRDRGLGGTWHLCMPGTKNNGTTARWQRKELEVSLGLDVDDNLDAFRHTGKRAIAAILSLQRDDLNVHSLQECCKIFDV